MADVIAFEEIVRARRHRVHQALHAQCRELIDAAVRRERQSLHQSPARDYWMRLARLQKLEALQDYVAALS